MNAIVLSLAAFGGTNLHAAVRNIPMLLSQRSRQPFRYLVSHFRNNGQNLGQDDHCHLQVVQGIKHAHSLLSSAVNGAAPLLLLLTDGQV